MGAVSILAFFCVSPIFYWFHHYRETPSKSKIFVEHLCLAATFTVCILVTMGITLWSIDGKLASSYFSDVQFLGWFSLIFWSGAMVGVTDYYRYPRFRRWLNATVTFLTVITGLVGFLYTILN
jgi:succinate dehydrogenase hydrophobic anchor subunit